MSELQATLGNFPALVAIVCFFYSIAVLSTIELSERLLDYNDISNGRIVPLLKGSQGLIKVFY